MSFWNAQRLRTITGGVWLSKPAHDEAFGVSIDSRSIVPGQIFVALPGERTDGRAFLEQARAAGSPVAIVGSGEVTIPHDMGVLQVPCPREALVRLATAYRAEAKSLKVVAVTGSCGKTTTVRLIDAVLGRRFTGSASIKSFNNDIGVPLTLLNVPLGHHYVVCEVGTSSPGEIERLARICDPDVAVITSIGRAHLEGLGSIEGVACEKAQLMVHLRAGGLGVVPADAPTLEPFLRSIPRDRLVSFGLDPASDVRVTGITSTGDGTLFSINDRGAYRVGLIGSHNALNAACAVVVGRRFGLRDSEIAEGLATAAAPAMRLEMRKVGAVTIINDAYNANPDSMRAAIRTLAGITGGRRVAVLGDMLELGSSCKAEHQALGESIDREPIAEIVIGVGAHAGSITTGLTHRFPRSDDAAIAEIVALVEPGDIVLLKGSRGVALERVASALVDRFESGSAKPKDVEQLH